MIPLILGQAAMSYEVLKEVHHISIQFKTLIDLLVSVFCVFGLAYIVGHSFITLPIRTYLFKQNAIAKFFVYLFECAACSSFHYGWIGTKLGLLTFFDKNLTGYLSAGVFYASTSLLLLKAAGLYESVPHMAIGPVLREIVPDPVQTELPLQNKEESK